MERSLGKALLILIVVTAVAGAATYFFVDRNNSAVLGTHDVCLEKAVATSVKVENEDRLAVARNEKVVDTAANNTKVVVSKDNAAYNVWRDEGHKGTEGEFLSWIKDLSGKDRNGEFDRTAYDAWRERGHKDNSKTDFVNWVKDNAGAKQSESSNNQQGETKTAYNAWVGAGNRGTETEFLSWITDATTALTSPTSSGAASLLDNAKFESFTTIYDGGQHEIKVTGVPAGTEVYLADNKAVDMGTHRAFARLYHPIYGEKLLTATINITQAEIEGITFDDVVTVYDGSVKKIEVSGDIPEGVEVTYARGGVEFEGKTEVGVYQVTATLSGGNYNNLTLTAILDIQKADLTGLTFGSKTVKYDGTPKSIAVAGNQPVGVSVAYTNADGSKFTGALVPGVYEVKAMLDGGNNYNNRELQATLTIEKGTIKGVTFNNKTEQYDGTVKTIAVSGVIPDGVSVKYALLGGSPFDGATEAKYGGYYVTATLTGEYYETLILQAHLYIVQSRLAKVTGLVLGDQSSNNVNLSWEAVEKASTYKVYAYDDAGVQIGESEAVRETTYDIRGLLVNLLVYAGDYSFRVVAFPSSLNAESYAESELSEEMIYHHDRAKLRAPNNVRAEGGELKWDKVNNAFVYSVRIMPVDSDGNQMGSRTYGGDYLASSASPFVLSLATVKNDLNLPAGNYRLAVAAAPSSVMPNGALSINVKLKSDYSEYSGIFAVGE